MPSCPGFTSNMAWRITRGRIPGPGHRPIHAGLQVQSQVYIGPFTIAYCYQQKKDYKQAVEWYEKYLKVAKPGSKGYDFAADNLAYVKSELFMEEAR